MDDEKHAQVTLLSGGNPQIPKGDGPGPVEAYVTAMPGWKGEIGRHLDRLIAEAVPDAARAVRWNSPFFGVDGDGWFLSFHCFNKYVKVTWLNGAELDPPPPIAAAQEGVRYLHLTENDPIDDDQIRLWLTQAVNLPGSPIF